MHPSPPSSTFAESAKHRPTDERPNSLLRRSQKDSRVCRPSLTRTETERAVACTQAVFPVWVLLCRWVSPSTQPGGHPSLASTRNCPATVNFHTVRIFRLCFPLWSFCFFGQFSGPASNDSNRVWLVLFWLSDLHPSTRSRHST